MLQIDMEYDNFISYQKVWKLRTGRGKDEKQKIKISLLVAGMISAAMMTSGISVQAADF